MQWVVKKTDNHNLRCGHNDCFTNCQAPCHLPDKEMLNKCACINEEDGLCRVCGHSYMQHCHEASIFKREECVTDDIDYDMKVNFEKAESDEERAKMLYNNLEKELQKSLATGKQLSVKLFKDIAEFETLSGARNYAKLIENQLAVIEVEATSPDVKNDRQVSSNSSFAKYPLTFPVTRYIQCTTPTLSHQFPCSQFVLEVEQPTQFTKSEQPLFK